MSRHMFAEGIAPKIEIVFTQTRVIPAEFEDEPADVLVHWECLSRVIDLEGDHDYSLDGCRDPRDEPMQLMRVVLAVRAKCWSGDTDEFDPVLILTDNIRKKARREIRLSGLLAELGKEIRGWEDYFAG